MLSLIAVNIVRLSLKCPETRLKHRDSALIEVEYVVDYTPVHTHAKPAHLVRLN